MTAKEYLQQIKKSDNLINCKLREIESLNELATSVTASCSGDVVQTSGAKDKVGDIVAKIVDLQNEINKDINNYIDLKSNITVEINKIEPVLSQVLYLRYVNYMTFEQIAVEMHYSWRQIIRLHGQALMAFNDVIECHM